MRPARPSGPQAARIGRAEYAACEKAKRKLYILYVSFGTKVARVSSSSVVQLSFNVWHLGTDWSRQSPRGDLLKDSGENERRKFHFLGCFGAHLSRVFKISHSAALLCNKCYVCACVCVTQLAEFNYMEFWRAHVIRELRVRFNWQQLARPCSFAFQANYSSWRVEKFRFFSYLATLLYSN